MLSTIRKAVRSDIQNTHQPGRCHRQAGKGITRGQQPVHYRACQIAVIRCLQQIIQPHPADAVAAIRMPLDDIHVGETRPAAGKTMLTRRDRDRTQPCRNGKRRHARCRLGLYRAIGHAGQAGSLPGFFGLLDPGIDARLRLVRGVASAGGGGCCPKGKGAVCCADAFPID